MPDFGTPFYACWKSTRRSHFVGANTDGAAVTDVDLRDFALSTRFAGVHIGAGGDENYDQFKSVDGRTGKTLYDSGKIQRSANGAPVAKVLVADNGALAWTLGGTTLQVLDSKGLRTLSTGQEISALHFEGNRLVWFPPSGWPPQSETLG